MGSFIEVLLLFLKSTQSVHWLNAKAISAKAIKPQATNYRVVYELAAFSSLRWK